MRRVASESKIAAGATTAGLTQLARSYSETFEAAANAQCALCSVWSSRCRVGSRNWSHAIEVLCRNVGLGFWVWIWPAGGFFPSCLLVVAAGYRRELSLQS